MRTPVTSAQAALMYSRTSAVSPGHRKVTMPALCGPELVARRDVSSADLKREAGGTRRLYGSGRRLGYGAWRQVVLRLGEVAKPP
jgi:hypothetical protein